MAAAKRCDRCGRFYEIDPNLKEEYEYRVKAGRSDIDLCTKCAKELQDWMKTKNEQAEKDSVKKK